MEENKSKEIDYKKCFATFLETLEIEHVYDFMAVCNEENAKMLALGIKKAVKKLIAENMIAHNIDMMSGKNAKN